MKGLGNWYSFILFAVQPGDQAPMKVKGSGLGNWYSFILFAVQPGDQSPILTIETLGVPEPLPIAESIQASFLMTQIYRLQFSCEGRGTRLRFRLS